MRAWSRVYVGGLSLTVAISAPGWLSGQGASIDVDAAVACFESTTLDRWRESQDRLRPECQSVSAYLAPGEYPPATVEAAMDGLVELAITSDHRGIRIAAVSSIAMVGHPRFDVGIPVVPRLRRLYLAAPHPDVKRAAITSAAYQTDQAAAASLAELAATEPIPNVPEYHTPLPMLAVQALGRMGRPGEVALRRLATEDRGQDPAIRSQAAQELSRYLRRPE